MTTMFPLLAQMDDTNTSDTWQVATEDVATFDVPRFIRLFTINRIVTNYLNSRKNDSKGKDTSQTDPLHMLVSEIKDKQMHTIAYNILSRLINNGLKIYMIKWYNEKEQATVIESIFKQIILEKFGPEYQQLTTYYNKKYSYQCQVFNNDDLMREIFRYLTFKRGFFGELHDCSLVHSCWLYHVWSTKLLYGKYYLDEFIQATTNIGSESGDNINNNVTRSWERLVNLRHIAFDTEKGYLYSKPNDLLISRLSMLRHIEKIECNCGATHISIIKILMQQCKNKIEMFDVTMKVYYNYFNSKTLAMLSPLELANCKDIRTNNVYFYPIWTKECKHLEIKNTIDKKWCNHVINKCDCTGIEQFTSKYFAFEINVSDDSTVFKQFSQKFINLKQLNIDGDQIGDRYRNISILSLMELFSAIIIKNEASIHLTMLSPARHTISVINSTIERFMEKHGVNNNFIKHVSVSVPLDDQFIIAQTKKLIHLCCKNVEWLKYIFFGTKIKERKDFVGYIVACLRNMNKKSIRNINDDDDNDNKVNHSYGFGSIQVIDIKSMLWSEASLIVNEILGTEEMIDIFSKHSIFCNITQEYRSSDDDSNNCDNGKPKFEEICDRINLILKKQIPIDIRMTLNNVEIDECKKIFESYFGTIDYNNYGNIDDDNQATVLKQYAGAKCNDNKYCVALKFAQVSISVTWNGNGVYCRFVNARYRYGQI